MADRIGQQVGNYRLTHLLGWGSFAEVYLGEHIDLGTMVAFGIVTKSFVVRITKEELLQISTI